METIINFHSNADIQIMARHAGLPNISVDGQRWLLAVHNSRQRAELPPKQILPDPAIIPYLQGDGPITLEKIMKNRVNKESEERLLRYLPQIVPLMEPINDEITIELSNQLLEMDKDKNKFLLELLKLAIEEKKFITPYAINELKLKLGVVTEDKDLFEDIDLDDEEDDTCELEILYDHIPEILLEVAIEDNKSAVRFIITNLINRNFDIEELQNLVKLAIDSACDNNRPMYKYMKTLFDDNVWSKITTKC